MGNRDHMIFLQADVSQGPPVVLCSSSFSTLLLNCIRGRCNYTPVSSTACLTSTAWAHTCKAELLEQSKATGQSDWLNTH